MFENVIFFLGFILEVVFLGLYLMFWSSFFMFYGFFILFIYMFRMSLVFLMQWFILYCLMFCCWGFYSSSYWIVFDWSTDSVAYYVYESWSVIYIFILLSDSVRFFYVFFYGDFINFFMFLFEYILSIFRVSGRSMGFSYVCFIYWLVTVLGVMFFIGFFCSVGRFIGYIIILQNRLYILSVSISAEFTESADPAVSVDFMGDFFSGFSSVFYFDILFIFSVSVFYVFFSVDFMVVLMG